MPFKERYAIFGEMCHILRNVLHKEQFAIYGGMCNFRSNMPFLDKRVIFGEMCHFWKNVPFLEQCACHLWNNVPFMEQCAIFGRMYHFWSNVPFFEQSAIFVGIIEIGGLPGDFYLFFPFFEKCAFSGKKKDVKLEKPRTNLKYITVFRFWKTALIRNMYGFY